MPPYLNPDNLARNKPSDEHLLKMPKTLLKRAFLKRIVQATILSMESLSLDNNFRATKLPIMLLKKSTIEFRYRIKSYGEFQF